MSNEMIAVRLSVDQKTRLDEIASRENLSVSDVIRGFIENGVLISPPLSEKLQANAEILGMPISDLVNACLEIGAYLQPKSWEKLKFNRERASRHLTEAQQIVDIVNRHFNTPPVKWGKTNVY